MDASDAPATNTAAAMKAKRSSSTNDAVIAPPTTARARITRRCPTRSPMRPKALEKISMPAPKYAGMRMVWARAMPFDATRNSGRKSTTDDWK